MRLNVPLILASASPRRRELLRTLVDDFAVVTADEVQEAHDPERSPADLTEHNARLKATSVAARHPGALVLGADTLVYLDDEPLGKPDSLAEAATMLRRLSGRRHTVCTGVCLAGPLARDIQVFHDLTQVQFRPLDEATITEYLTKVHVLDKAGAYAAQERADLIIQRLDGSYSNVVGLPLEMLRSRLQPWVQEP
ncbi:MAG: Maf family protein [Verrucomicrobiales bacterium]